MPLTVTTNRDEALKVFLSGSAYDDRHDVLTLADDASKALGVKDGQLAIVEANSFYSVVRILDSTDEVKGAVAPKISDISNVYYYKLQFKANPKGNARLTLTSTGYDNPVTRRSSSLPVRVRTGNSNLPGMQTANRAISTSSIRWENT